MIQLEYINRIATELNITAQQVNAVIALQLDGCTIPFIARYRKEKTSGLDELQISTIMQRYQDCIELSHRKDFILETINQQGLLTDALRKKISDALDLLSLEDIYAPFKKKKKTKADIAKENGIMPFAEFIMRQSNMDAHQVAKNYICDMFLDINAVIQAATDIIAEDISNDDALRISLRNLYFHKYQITSRIIKSKAEDKEALIYKDYFDFKEPIKRIPSHRYLAIERGENQKFLRIKFDCDMDEVYYKIKTKFVINNSSSGRIVADACEYAWSKSLQDIIENQVRTILKDQSDKVAIEVFSTNIKQLFLEAPLGEKKLIAIDPGYRTGSKVAVLDEYGALLDHYTIYPLAPVNNTADAISKLSASAHSYAIKYIVIGDGTGGRELMDLLRDRSYNFDMQIFTISEQGASIYSASDIARQEFPELDLTYRGAISIGRRLLDPMAELIKIDPKSIGIGQYQHDVNQKWLRQSLEITLESVVNVVGVNLNTASKYLLQHISGLNESIADQIIKYRNQNGKFKNKNQILNVPRIGAKTFEQCAGFLRIKNGDSILDNTAIHPMHYELLDKICHDQNLKLNELISNQQMRDKIPLERYCTAEVGLPSLHDIMTELQRPGIDPRGEIQAIVYEDKIRKIEDVTEGMILQGSITNITNFGAFVDIGIKATGLIHVSELSHQFVRDPNQIVSLKQHVRVKVIAVDIDRGRIRLSMKL